MKFEIDPGSRARALLFAVISCAMLSPGPAFAQSIDYATTERLFGEPVTTSATGSPLRATEAPADITILTQDDIRRSGADNLPDILALVPGIEISRNSFGDADISIRGYNTLFAPRLLVLLNSRPVFDDFYAFVPWGAIPVELADIRQIEIVRGPNMALFGFNAAAGVINIITFDPLYDKVNTASVRTGTQSLAGGSAVSTAQNQGQWGLRLSAGGARADEYAAQPSVSPGQSYVPDHPLAAEVSAEGRYLVRPGIELTLESGLSQNHYDAQSASSINSQLRTNFQRALLAADTGIGGLELAAYRNETHENVFDLGESTNETNDVYDVRASDTVKLGASNILRANVDYRDNSSNSSDYFRGTFGYRDVAASLMWDWQFATGWSLTNAVRFDRLDFYYTGEGLPAAGLTPAAIDGVSHNGVSFNSGLVWAATPVDTLRLLLARGLQLPSLLNAGFQFQPGPNLFFVGTPTLAPTAVTSAEFSYDRTLAAIASVLHGAVFAERNDNLIAGPAQAGTTISNGNVFQASANIGHSDEVGLELGLKGDLPFGIRWNTSYALASITDHLHQGLPILQFNSFAGSTPRHTLIAGLGYSAGPWELDTNARWQSHFVQPGNFLAGTPVIDNIDGFLTLSARVACNITKRLTVAITGNQLLRTRIPETPGLEVERRGIVSLTARL